MTETTVSHTPGPWDVSPDDLEKVCGTIDRQGIAVMSGARRHWDERQANAKLIAAAPELLRALKEAKALLVEIESKDLMGGNSKPTRNVLEVIDLVSKEIDKAEGKVK